MAAEQQLAILKQGVNTWNEWRSQNPGVRPDFRKADLFEEDFRGANLGGANCACAYLRSANLGGADLRGVDLHGAYLRSANLGDGADLRGARLIGANLGGANLGDANLKKCRVGWTIFASNDLSSVQSLGEVIHEGPSTIGIDTLYASHGKTRKYSCVALCAGHFHRPHGIAA